MGKIEVTDMDENAKQLFSLGDADAKYFMWSIEDFFATGQRKGFKNTPYELMLKVLVWLNVNVSVKSIWRSLTSKTTSLNTT